MIEPKVLSIRIESHLEQTGDEEYPVIDICDSVTVNGQEIDIPSGMTVQISKNTKSLH